MNKEELRPAPEYEDHYQISNLGNVYSKAVFIPHDGNWDKTQKGYIKKCKKHKTRLNRYGYVVAKLCKYGKCRTLTVHRLVAKAFLKNPNKYVQVNHIDGNKQNNNVSNLEWTSRSGNMKHAYETGLIDKKKISGENHNNAKLTQQDVNEIRELFGKQPISTIASKYNVSVSTINDIKYKRTWTI